MKLFRKTGKVIAAFLALNILTELVLPSAAFALTGGPSQPEVQSFEPVGTTQMVDPFTGDFNYNIPLLDVGGYPINLSYHAGPSMDEEASWVGLGWNINPGVINRNVRGLPDDFNGQTIKRQQNIKDNQTFGVNAGVTWEIFGFEAGNIGLTAGLGISYNNYRGLGYETYIAPSLSIGKENSPSLNANLGITASTQGGVTLTPSASLSITTSHNQQMSDGLSLGVGMAYNSLQGLKSVNYGLSYNFDKRYDGTKKSTRLINGSIAGSTYSFSMPTYTPYTDMPMKNFAFNFKVSVGASAWGTYPDGYIEGYYAGQSLRDNEVNLPGYGYLYAHNGTERKALHDFNREKDGVFSEITPGLPLANHTYDVYAVSGQGLGGSYRPYRSDIGILYDSETGSEAHSLNDLSIGIEIGGGAYAHLGANIHTGWSESNSGMWKDNAYSGIFGFGTKKDDPLYEPAYFKRAGEMVEGIDKERFDGLGGFEPVRPEIEESTQNLTMELKKSDKNAAGKSLNGFNNKRSARAKRDQHIANLTVKDLLKGGGLQGNVYSYKLNDFTNNTTENVTLGLKDDQIGEVTVTKEDGARYVYGIPACNNSLKEVSFATNDNSAVTAYGSEKGIVKYNQSNKNENSLSNTSGNDNYFNSVSTPSYAHSYLLTAILSQDYEDSDYIQGPSVGDKGNYVVINYTRAVQDYQWRVPYESENANFNHAMLSAPDDNKASYIYGTKDVWYIHSMESKNHIAEFELNDNRADGFEVQGEDGGGNGSRKLMSLKEIRLYSKGDKAANSNGAQPIKVVHFEYDYSLCPGIPNSAGNQNPAPAGINSGDGGKLTLKKVYFTYNNSVKGKLSPYEFRYETWNPHYDGKGSSRWGTYKPDSMATLSNAEYPYILQKDPKVHAYAGAWSLSKIILPSGGVMNIEYESDDYAYVQNKKAMEMMVITGAGTTPDPSDPKNNGVPNTQLFNGDNVSGYLYFDLDSNIPASTPDAARSILGTQYFKDEEGRDLKDSDQWTYFKFQVNLDNTESGKEFIQGYMQVEDYGVIGSAGPFSKGYMKVKAVPTEGNSGSANAHPISKTAWQFLRRNNIQLVTKKQMDSKFSKINVSDPGSFVSSVAGNVIGLVEVLTNVDQYVQMIEGFNDNVKGDGFASVFEPNRSWVRLYNPSNKKFGGGYRVKRITLNDQWKELAGNLDNYKDAEYGQEFDYTIDDENLGAGISSGVASYEPVLGGDENPLRQPVFFTDEVALGPDNQYMQETPYGESFYPAAGVGYRKVTVTSLKHDKVSRHATGKTVQEFFTAKDFPIPQGTNTPIDVKQSPFDWKDLILNRIFGIDSEHKMSASQGYVVELNDMHGKPKAQWSYPEGSTSAVSGVTYKYKTNPNGTLDNNVKVLRKEGGGAVEDGVIGVEADIVIDMRESETDNRSIGANGNIDVIPALFIPFPVPAVWPHYQHENTRFRSASITKVIYRFGILQETTNYDQSARTTVSNEAFDAETGQVLLIKSNNNYEDPVYTFTYPAHWAYEGMGPVYKNQGLTASMTFSNGQATFSNASSYFTPGDILLVDAGSYVDRVWVTQVNGDKVYAEDFFGNDYSTTGAKQVKLVRSGRRNLAHMPIGSVISLSNPLDGNKLSFTNVINAVASEFSDNWKNLCDCGLGDLGEGSTTNPYLIGENGDWRLKTAHAYLTARVSTNENGNTNIRRDGIFESFFPFWAAAAATGKSWQKVSIIGTNPWQAANTVKAYNPMGYKLESVDAVGVYASSLYGYGHTLPTGMADNAMYKEIGFDNFEDYDYKDCYNDHFSFSAGGSSSVTSEQSHSGQRSMLVAPNSRITMKRKIK